MILRRLSATMLGPAAALVLIAGCSDSDEPEASEPTRDPVAEQMLNSVQSPGLGLSGSVPMAERSTQIPEGSGRTGPRAPAQDRNVDVASLGYDSGPDDAPVRVLEFSDFGCGYCRRFHAESFPVLEGEYMDAGKVQWKYIPIVIGLFPNALEAARAGECAGEQGRFPVMRDLLFERQREWKASNDPEPLLEGYAREVGLEMERFNSCVSQRWQDGRIQAGTQLSRQVGVRGTPTFFVVGYAPIPGAIPLDLFRQVLDTVYVERTTESGGD